MPIYDYKCEICGLEDEFITKYYENAKCPVCNLEMVRLLHSKFGINMGPAGAYGYYDSTLRKYIHTNQQRRDEMDRQGVTEYGATPKQGGAWI